ncbi:hypothetical protein [Streptomyces sp. ME18-1-4]|uniref:hypothetical protein n=1 Tax=Streptomyces sp. ME18-1-4 TaxID=3028685 RepID=UPI0029B2EF45|nr:hypothetical protein [Streptomyces sp. ME18-1-4]MDX3243475.1 hypothetical protein [Streptomyces sp. ME18-1-4]
MEAVTDTDTDAARPPFATGGLRQRVRPRLGAGIVDARQQDTVNLVRRLAEQGHKSQATWLPMGS